jgi:PIN domain nuclease of toxin-antitoxin system
MIVLDTHIWIWWVHGEKSLTASQAQIIEDNETDVIGISVISLWEIAKLVEYNRLELPCPLHEWFNEALNYPGVRLIELTPEIAITSTQLPGQFHHDPADQIIVATAITNNCKLITSDSKIIRYPYVMTL